MHNFLTQIDPNAFSQCLNIWLESNLGTLPRALAVDGKWIRDRALSLCLSDHETGAPVAIGFAAQTSKTDQNKREGEQTVALEPRFGSLLSEIFRIPFAASLCRIDSRHPSGSSLYTSFRLILDEYNRITNALKPFP